MYSSDADPQGTERMTRAVYVISIAAELSGMHPQTLRIYERKGLVAPARTPGGSRRYSDEDIRKLQVIATLTNEGLNLEGVKRILELEAENVRLRSELARLEALRRRQVDEAHREHRRDLVPVKSDVELHESRRRQGR